MINVISKKAFFLFTISALATAGATAAPIVYPAKGQSTQQQQKDDGECYEWAKTSTGVDPAVLANAAAAPKEAGGQRLRGAAGGALGGAAIGAVAGDTGKGAAIGAVAGTLAGGVRARREHAMAQEVTTQNAAALENYARAHAACMEGRGYTVK